MKLKIDSAGVNRVDGAAGANAVAPKHSQTGGWPARPCLR
jgi:hypothetical protein